MVKVMATIHGRSLITAKVTNLGQGHGCYSWSRSLITAKVTNHGQGHVTIHLFVIKVMVTFHGQGHGIGHFSR